MTPHHHIANKTDLPFHSHPLCVSENDLLPVNHEHNTSPSHKNDSPRHPKSSWFCLRHSHWQIPNFERRRHSLYPRRSSPCATPTLRSPSSPRPFASPKRRYFYRTMIYRWLDDIKCVSSLAPSLQHSLAQTHPRHCDK